MFIKIQDLHNSKYARFTQGFDKNTKQSVQIKVYGSFEKSASSHFYSFWVYAVIWFHLLHSTKMVLYIHCEEDKHHNRLKITNVKQLLVNANATQHLL